MTDKDIKEMKNDFKDYVSGSGKTAYDLAELYLASAGKMPGEKKTSENETNSLLRELRVFHQSDGVSQNLFDKIVNKMRQEYILAQMKREQGLKKVAEFFIRVLG